MADLNQTESPLACDMTAIPAAQRPVHLATSRELFSKIAEFRELPDGYEFRLADGPDLLTKLGEFVSLERLCCPFLRFHVEVEAEGGPVWLRLSGREGVKEFIREEISGLTGFTGFTNRALLSWSENAKYWIQYSDTIRAMFTPLTAAMIEHAKIVEGQTVLDVAGGSGEPGLTIAEKVGPGGSVTCTDAVAEMVEAARHEATRRGLTNVQFHQCSADSLPFPDNAFDATVCRLGIMFVPDPLAAVREMLRVTKPGGKLALAVWHKSEINPFCYIVTNVMAQHVTSPPDPDAPNAFRFAETGKLADVLSQAGASDVQEREVRFNIEAPISPSQFWTMRSQTSDTLREKLAKLSTAEQAQIANEVQQGVKEFFPHNQMNFPAQMILVTATKAADLHE